MKLICRFEHLGKYYFTEIRNISDVYYGFWVDINMQFNPSDKCDIWIPANKVEYVEYVGRVEVAEA